MRVKAADITAHLRYKYWWNSLYNMFIHHLLLNVSEVYHLFLGHIRYLMTCDWISICVYLALLC
jgi:hypothetical protein